MQDEGVVGDLPCKMSRQQVEKLLGRDAIKNICGNFSSLTKNDKFCIINHIRTFYNINIRTKNL